MTQQQWWYVVVYKNGAKLLTGNETVAKMLNAEQLKFYTYLNANAAIKKLDLIVKKHADKIVSIGYEWNE